MFPVALALVQAAASADAPHANLSESLYWASSEATGSRLCDRARSARYGAQFDARYGRRVQALKRYHVAKSGPDPDFIITTSCRLSRRSGRQQDHDHALALDRFEQTLRDLERSYGPAPDGR